MVKRKNVQKNQTFKERGITLIALVITIIVLLILAGVTLSALTGDSGILSNAEKAKDKTEQANLKEEVSLKVIEDELDTENKLTLEQYLNQISNAEVTPIGEDTFLVTRNQATVTVYKTGEVIEGNALWAGKESSESPEIKKINGIFNWYIYTPAQLKFLADFVNQGGKVETLTTEQQALLTDAGYDLDDVGMTAETTVYLMNDLDLGAREVNGEWENQIIYTDKTDASKNKTNEDFEWTAIGKTNTTKFIATFEGNGNTIRGVYINTDTYFNGIFGNVSNSIKNLTIENSYIQGANCTAGIVGASRSGKVENCHNRNTTVTLIEGPYFTVGGVVAQSAGDILNCSNTGKIVAKGIETGGTTGAGGVVGKFGGILSNCYNAGEVTGTGSIVGGVVASVALGSTILNCYNTGMVTGYEDRTGGVIGTIDSPETVSISNCYNTGAVTGHGFYTGGVIGNIGSTATVSISNCYNTGEVTGHGQCTGGVLGYKYNTSGILVVTNCYNSGTVTGKASYTGGLVGAIRGSSAQEERVTQCYNKGQVTGTTSVGAIIGNQENVSTLNNLYYLNTVGIGAINGEDKETNKIMSTTENITSYKKFLEWIQGKLQM